MKLIETNKEWNKINYTKMLMYIVGSEKILIEFTLWNSREFLM